MSEILSLSSEKTSDKVGVIRKSGLFFYKSLAGRSFFSYIEYLKTQRDSLFDKLSCSDQSKEG